MRWALVRPRRSRHFLELSDEEFSYIVSTIKDGVSVKKAMELGQQD